MLAPAPGYSSSSTGKTSRRIRLRVYFRMRLEQSTRYDWPRCSRYCKISCLRCRIRGRTTRPRTGGIPESPRSPAPRARFISTVSATSSAMCPVAMAEKPPASASSLAIRYRPRRASSCRLLPLISRRRTSQMIPSRVQSSCTNSTSSRDSSPRSPWSTCNTTGRLPSSTSARNSATESGPPETITSGRERSISKCRAVCLTAAENSTWSIYKLL
jgi:hypothetical protein